MLRPKRLRPLLVLVSFVVFFVLFVRLMFCCCFCLFLFVLYMFVYVLCRKTYTINMFRPKRFCPLFVPASFHFVRLFWGGVYCKTVLKMNVVQDGVQITKYWEIKHFVLWDLTCMLEIWHVMFRDLTVFKISVQMVFKSVNL